MYEKLRSADTATKAAQALLELARSPWVVAWLLEVVARGIPDMLSHQPLAIDAIADAVGANPQSLYRVLRAMAGIGLFNELRDRHFGLTEAGRLLRADHPLSQRDGLLLTREDFYRRLFERVPDILTTGVSGFELEHGEPLFQHTRSNPRVARAVDLAMTCLTNAYLQSILTVYSFDGMQALVDLGCGQGRLVFAILKSTPSVLRATLLDLPHVIAVAKVQAIEAGVADRCEFVGASYFDAASIPVGADCYLLKHNCHDYSDSDVVQLLTNVRRAFAPCSRALLIDGMLPSPNTYSLLLGMDLAGLALLPAASKERSQEEWGELVGASGLAVRRAISTDSDLSILEVIAFEDV